jgi:penicillin-binding protein 2
MRWFSHLPSHCGRCSLTLWQQRAERSVAVPSFPRRPLVEPVSTAERGFFRGAGFFVRVGILSVVALTMFGLLGLRLWSLQVIQGPRFAHVAQAQSFRVIRFPTARAAILDDAGRVLAGTSGQLAVTIDTVGLGKTDKRGHWHPNAIGRAQLRRIAWLAHVPLWTLVARVKRSLRRNPFAPADVLPDVSRSLAFYVEERLSSFRGVQVTNVPSRWYPLGAFGSEFLGLLGQVNPAELREPTYRYARAGQVVGQSGIEAAYDRLLNGGLARARVPVDARGTVVGPLRWVPRHRADRALELSVDSRLQRVAEQAIRDGIALAHRNGHSDAQAGAAVVMNPWDGSIYALASYPNFDQAAASHNSNYLASLLRGNSATPLVNRATQGLYPTGSTFKPIAAEAALSDGLITPSSIIPCTGSLTVGNVVFHNVEAGINADLNLDQALSMSCDTWFYRLGTMFYARQAATGALDLQNWAKRLGLGRQTGIDLPGESAGVVPTPGWLRRTFRDPAQQIWYEGYSVNLSIGQGYLAVTPLQLAVAYSALANGGTIVRPHVGRAIVDGAGDVLQMLHFRPRGHVALKDAWAIRQGLYDAAHVGTSASVFASFPIPVAGKTGTAQTPTGSDHSWYATWAPYGHPRVLVVVLIEHGGFGAEAAAPAAKEIYSAFFHVH